MTKTSYACGITAVLLCLSFSQVRAEDSAEPQATQPVVTQDQENQSKPKPKEETATPNDSKSSASKEEPECN